MTADGGPRTVKPSTAYRPPSVFSCANPLVDGTVYVYYGGGDHIIGLATCRLDDLLDFVLHAE